MPPRSLRWLDDDAEDPIESTPKGDVQKERQKRLIGRTMMVVDDTMDVDRCNIDCSGSQHQLRSELQLRWMRIE